MPGRRIGVVAGTKRRERKKQHTRQAIADAALALFAQRGFDAVTVAEVAEAADVARQTVFNYFPAKEDLVFGAADTGLQEQVQQAVRACRPGQYVLDAVRPLLLGHFEQALAAGEFEAIETTARLIENSPALRARQHADAARWASSMADAIAETMGAGLTDIEPLLVANATIGVYQAVFEVARRRVRAGQHGRHLRAQLRKDVATCLALLDAGLKDYRRP